jgi:AraC-like DNA-binding protein
MGTKMNTTNRIVLGNGQRGGHALLPEILEVGWGHFSAADRGHLQPHAHVDAFEICYIVSGEVEWGTADSFEVLRAGDVYITQPSEPHWGRDTAMHPCTLYWLILGSPSCGFDWPGADPALTVHLNSRLCAIREHRLPGTSKIEDAFKELFDEHNRESPSPHELLLRQGNARAALHSLLIELVRLQERQTAVPSSDAPLVLQALEKLSGRLQDREALRNFCSSSGMSYKALNRQFIERFGTSLSQYSLRARVRSARERLLNTELSVTDVATEFGFSSSQHFATVFRRFTGLTPSECRNTR